MPSVSTQTDVSTVSDNGFNTWCVENRDTVDNIQTAPNTELRKRILKKLIQKDHRVQANALLRVQTNAL